MVSNNLANRSNLDHNQENNPHLILSNAQRKNIKRRGRRALYDLPPRLIKRVANIAEQLSLTNSQVAGALLLHSLKDLKNGEINLHDFRVSSDSPRYNYKIDLDKLIVEWEI